MRRKIMKKMIRCMLPVVVFAALALFFPVFSGNGNVVYAAGDFEITNGVLTNYNGKGGAVTVPSNVTAIADHAFYGCGNITSLTISQGVRTVGEYAFTGCSSMRNIAIPASVKSIGNWSFDGCSRLERIETAADSPYFCSVGGVLFNHDQTTLVRYPEGLNASSYTVPSSVKTIGTAAFSNCMGLKKLTLPSGVTMIRDNAFYQMKNVTSIAIPATVTSIGNSAFYSAQGLKTLTLETKNPSIAANAFRNTSIARILYAGTTTQWVNANMGEIFGSSAVVYYNMSGYTVDDDVLVRYSGTAESVSVPGFIVRIDDKAFYRSGVKSVTLPTSLKYIGQSAFDSCMSLERITIPSSVVSIEKWAFDNCLNLSRILVASDNNNYSASGGVLFNKDKSQLLRYPPAMSGENFVIPDSVKVIGDSSFSRCNELKKVTIPEGVTTIENYAFDQCDNITSVEIPASVTSVGGCAFRSDRMLKTVTLRAVSPTFGRNVFANDSISEVFYAGSETQWKNAGLGGVFGGSVKVYYNITGFVFDGTVLMSYSGNASSVTIPGFVTKINARAFNGCTSVKSLTIPSSVTFIGESAFKNCSALKTLTIPASVTTIEKWAFDGCTGLSEIQVAKTNPGYSSYDGVLYDKGGKKVLRYPPDKAGNSYVFPANTRTVGDSAFSDCHHLTELVIRSGIETIEQYAFDKCSHLARVTIASSVKSVDRYAFRSEPKLKTVLILAKSVSINYQAFKNDLPEVVCFAGSRSQWNASKLDDVFSDGTTVYCDYSYPVVVQSPSDKTAVAGQSIHLSVQAKGSGLKYQWYFKKAGQTSWNIWKNHVQPSENVIPNATWNGISLYCMITDAAGISVNSNSATILLKEAITVTQQPKDETVEKGSSITLSVKASGSGLKYQWYFKKAGQTAWNVWKNRTHTSETVTPNDTWNGIQLYCLIKDCYGNSVRSDVITVTLKETIRITAQPRSRTIVKGSSVTLSVKASGSGLKYQWYFKKAGQTSWNVWKTHTHASETVTPNDTWDGIQLYCRITDSAGNSTQSDIATVRFGTPLKITSQPADKTVSVGETITLSVKAQGSGLKYQWYFKKAGQTSWNVWKSHTHSSETVAPNASWNGIKLYCLITDSAGDTVKSDVVTVTVKA